jgi:hypothetical protein
VQTGEINASDQVAVVVSNYDWYDNYYQISSYIWQTGQGFSPVAIYPSGYNYVTPYMDDAGHTAGYYNSGIFNNGGVDLPIRYLGNGKYIIPDASDAGTPGGFSGRILGVNPAGDAVGYIFNYSNNLGQRAALWKAADGGARTDLGIGATSVAVDINGSGTIVGYQISGGSYHPFVYQSGAVVNLQGLPGYAISEPVAINNSGWIIGTAGNTPGDQPQGVLWKPDPQSGQYTVPSALGFTPVGINDNNVVIGKPSLAWSEASGVVDLNSLLRAGSGWTLQSVTGINAQNDIVGTGNYTNGPQGNSKGFLLTGLGLPQLTATSLKWNTSQGGVDFSYQVGGDAVSKDTSVALYWSSSNQFKTADVKGGPVYSKDIPAGTATGSYGPFNVSAAALGQPPDGAKYLLVVTDPNNVLGNFDPSKNVQALAVPDLAAESLSWHTTQADVSSTFTPDNGGGVDLGYSINDPLPAPATVALYWVHGTMFDRNQADTYALAYQTESETAPGSYPLHVPASELKNIPSGANGADNDLNLVLVVDAPIPGNPNGSVIESDQEHDTVPLRADPVSIVTTVTSTGNQDVRSVVAQATTDDQDVRSVMEAVFRPAGGALMLQQAATIIGVNHFNWIQTITGVPSNWLVRRIDPKTGAVEQTFFAPPYVATPPQGGFPPWYDPDIGSPGVVETIPYYLGEPSEIHGLVQTTGLNPDDYIYYYNDLDQANTETTGIRLSDVTQDFQLYFWDRPAFTPGGFDPEGAVSFLTQLAGVPAGALRAGGNPVTWSNIGSNFIWQSNAIGNKFDEIIDGGIVGVPVYTRTSPLDPNLPPIISGGVFNVQYDDQTLATTTAVASDHALASTYGQPVTFSATVSPAGSATGTPAGSVQFDFDGAPVGSPITLVNGSASLTTAALSAGTHTVTAFYTSDSSNFSNSDDSAAPFTQTVSPALLTVTGDDQTRVYGQANPPLTFHVSGFVNGDTASVLAGAPTLATEVTATSPVGPYPITVAPGTLTAANYTFAFVNGTLHVNPAATGTALGVSLLTPLAGVDTVALTASVTVTPPGSGSPTGSFDFFDTTTGTDLGTVGLSNGTATLTVGPLTVGEHTITATYLGDNNFLQSSGTASLEVIPPASLSGTVFEDFNDDGQIDFGERGIPGVVITLGGTDDLEHAVSRSLITDGDGTYLFNDLRPGSYTITEAQPAGFTQGIDTVGTWAGIARGSLAGADQFFDAFSKDDYAAIGTAGINYNFGERPAATGPVQRGQTAGIGFWNNKNGQSLILSLNGGTGTQLGDWLAATFVNTFGRNAGANNLAGKGNAYVAAFFQAEFQLQGPKLDAQLLATALSVYVTNATLDPTKVAAPYGFTVGGDGAGTATANVGSSGDAFGVANNTTMTVMDLLLATDEQAVDGLLYGGNAAKRNEANAVYSALNQSGGL